MCFYHSKERPCPIDVNFDTIKIETFLLVGICRTNHICTLCNGQPLAFRWKCDKYGSE